MPDQTNALPPHSAPVKRGSLNRYLAIVIFACIAIPALVSGSILIHTNFTRTIEVESRTAAEGYADVLEAGMSVPLWNLSPDLGQPIVENVFVDPSVLSVVVYTESGKKFLEYVRSNEALADRVIPVVRDVTFDDKVIGRLELGYSVDKAKSQANKEAKLLAIIICAQLIVSLTAISFLLHRRVLSPLKKLDQAAEGIAQGDLSTTIPYLSHDEFGSLSLQLEKMRHVLEENFTELEARVDTRTAQLQEVNQTLKGTLEQLQQAQDNLVQSEKLAALGSLVAGVAHELNTPIGNGLTVISSMCESCESFEKSTQEGITRKALENFKSDMLEGTRLVCNNLEKASELVSSFKQVAVDRTSAQRRKFSLKSFLEETLLTVSPIFKRSPYRVSLNMSEDIEMDAYPGPLGQVITNLLSNTVIHAFAGRDHGTVGISVRTAESKVEISVKDDGVGIPFENQAKIFDPFFTTKMGEGGNGLGMNIVHNIVTGVLGGKIALQSAPDQGTTFTITLPMKAPEDVDEVFKSLDFTESKMAC